VRAAGTILAIGAGVSALASLMPSCATKEPQPATYFDQTIAPIVTSSCARGPTGAGCHVADAKGNAFGNLDISTYAGIDRRRDLFAAYGPYGQPALLLKATPPAQLPLVSFDGQRVAVTSDVKHTGGPILDPTSSGYQILREWIERGASEVNAGAPPAPTPVGSCASAVRAASGLDPTADPGTPDFAAFEGGAQPVLVTRCAAGSCHGSPFNSLYLTCGTSPEQVRWNYFVASGYLGATPEQSELLRRPLASGGGGSFHEGGAVFGTVSDDGYQAVLDWAQQHGPPDPGTVTPGFDFFAHRVQPALARKGCMMLHCHSASIFHDYRLSGGSGGSFSLAATRRNYTLTLAQLALESDDPGASRLVRKNLYRPEVFAGGGGIVHRGGPLFEDFGPQPASAVRCDQKQPPYDYDAGSLDEIPPFCVVREWLRRERQAQPLAGLSAVVYVRRPLSPDPDRMQDFDVYAPGAELHVVSATLAAAGGAITLGADVVVNASCGLDPSTADVRRPQVSWDGTRVAFAARSSASEPLAIYEMNADGTGCAKNAAIAAHPTTQGGLLVHDFDPAYSPPEADGSVHLVFASTRGQSSNDAVDYSGPQRTPADPSKPNADLFAYEPDPAQKGQMRIRQLTYLLDMERAPSFMQDGRLIFTVEKREPGFYQLALRRMNIDGGDYHPLYAQRSSIGFHEASQVVELSDKDFLAIFAEAGVPHHGGALGLFNRSIGIDFGSADAADYPVDSTVMDPSSPSSPEPSFFLHSLRFPDGMATGRLHGSTSGVYASPAALPDGRALVSFGLASESASFDGDYDLYVFDATTGAATTLLGQSGAAEVDAVAVFARAPRGVYRSGPGEANAYALDESLSSADVTMHDARILASLVFQNTPTGRVREQLPGFEVWEELPPPADMTSFAQGGTNVATDAFGQVYVRRRRLGTVPLLTDGSAHWRVPGGVPLVLHLLDSPESRAMGLPRWQREEIMFTPGEFEHEAMRSDLFDGFCGQCHGAASGRAVDEGMRPDVLMGASQTVASTAPATDLVVAPNQRGPTTGPPSTP
jgi:hypothetical protein